VLAVPNLVDFRAEFDSFGELVHGEVRVVGQRGDGVVGFFLEYILVDLVKVLHDVFLLSELSHEFRERD
jgi:hypothetical protein